MRDWESEKQRREQLIKNRADSKRRCDLHSDTWEEWTPEEAARHFMQHLGPAVFAHRTLDDASSKIIYTNRGTGWKIVVDVEGSYFTIMRPWIVGATDGGSGQMRDCYVARDGDVSPTGREGKYHFKMRKAVINPI
jgi:hypothetical protein